MVNSLLQDCVMKGQRWLAQGWIWLASGTRRSRSSLYRFRPQHHHFGATEWPRFLIEHHSLRFDSHRPFQDLYSHVLRQCDLADNSSCVCKTTSSRSIQLMRTYSLSFLINYVQFQLKCYASPSNSWQSNHPSHPATVKDP